MTGFDLLLAAMPPWCSLLRCLRNRASTWGMAGSDVLPLHDEWVVVESSVYMETGGVLGVKIQSFSRCGAGPPVYGLLLSKTVSVTLFGWRRTPTSTSDHMCAHIRAISSKPGEHLGIPRSFHFDSLLHGLSFGGNCRMSYTSGHPLETRRLLGDSQIFSLRFVAPWH